MTWGAGLFNCMASKPPLPQLRSENLNSQISALE